MPSLDLPHCLIWFAHCPKAGGTSVEKLMVDTWGDRVGNLHWGWDLWWKNGGWRLADPPNSPQHLVWSDALKVLPDPPDAVFAVVRDPADRLVSEYLWQRQARRGTRAGKALAHLPFSFWLRLMLKTAARHPRAFDNHLRPQGDFIPEHARVFRLEDGLGPVADWLAGVTGDRLAPEAMPHALARRGAVRVRAVDAALMGKVFAPDYARFGYVRSCGVSRRPVLDLLAGILAPAVAFLDRRGQL